MTAAKSENTQLRTPQAGTESTQTNAPGALPKQEWRFVGYSSPETTLQSLLYSLATGDFDSFMGGLASADRESFLKEDDLTKEKFAAETQGTDKIAAYRILGREPSSTDEKVILSVEVLEVTGKTKQQMMTFTRDGKDYCRMTHRK